MSGSRIEFEWVVAWRRSGIARCVGVGRPGMGGGIWVMAYILVSLTAGRNAVEGDPGEQAGLQLPPRFLLE